MDFCCLIMCNGPKLCLSHRLKKKQKLKCLVRIVPGGGFSFILSVFPRSISDKDITVQSGLLTPKLFECGDGFMDDRGFTIKE